MSDDNENKPDNHAEIIKLLSNWPVLDTLDFEGITVDVTEWDKETYTATFNFHLPSETGEPPYSGFSLCTQLGGESLQEVWDRVDALLSIGLFDGVEVSATGTLWNADGDEIATIDWTDYGDGDDGEGDEEQPAEKHDEKPVLH